MSDDLLGSARDLRQKLYRLEVLLDIEKGRKGRESPAGKSPQDAERAAAIARLSDAGLIEATTAPERLRLSAEGRDFLKVVRAKVTSHGMIDWTRVDEIDFSRL